MGNFKYLPTEILLDIITRLPAETILDCKLVCKPWKNVVSHHPLFSQMHLARLGDLESGKLSFLVLGENQDLYYFEYDNEKHAETSTDCITKIKFTPPFETHSYLLGSFNGLVCVHGWLDCAYAICNPLTREYVLLPKFERPYEDYIVFSSGFGYLPLTNEFKVVFLYTLRYEHSIVEAAVYTLGSGKGWRIVGRSKFAHPSSADYGVYANGALHWKDHASTRVLVFDLTEEKFLEHLSPPPLPLDDLWEGCAIGDLGGVLYYATKYRDVGHICSDIWLLKEKNDDVDMKQQLEQPLGWRKEFSLQERQPFAFTKAGGVLCFDDNCISIYDAIASTSKKLLDGIFIQIIPHKNSLASLKELGEGDIKKSEPVEIEEI